MPLLFLNERSCGSGCDPSRAGRAMTTFARTVVTVARADAGGTVLVCEVPLGDLQIADGYPVGKWLDAHPRNIEEWRRLRRVQNRAPFKVVLPDGEEPFDVEYRYAGQIARGLGAAHLMDGIGVSLPVHTTWNAARLTLDRERLVEMPDGSAVTQADQAEVRHVSDEEHLAEHLAWIKATRAAGVRTGADLWEKRGQLFPHLRFLPRVEDQLRGLQQLSLPVLHRRLADLEEAAAEWQPDPAADDHAPPPWRGNVRPEHQQREQYCWFTDLDGESRLFEWHTDYPPTPGRVYFRLVQEDGTLRVAHIGRKRGV